MSHAVLKVVHGLGAGQEISLTDEVTIGTAVSGPGRIQGDPSSVAGEHMIVRLTALGIEVEGIDPEGRTHVGPSGGSSLGAGKRSTRGWFASPSVYLRVGGRIELRPYEVDIGERGDRGTAIEVASLDIDWMNNLGPDDLLDPVRFRPGWARRAQPGYLHAAGGQVALWGRDGPFLSGTTSQVRALFPPWRSRLIRLRGGDARCTLLLGNAEGFGVHTGSAEAGALIGTGVSDRGVDPIGEALFILGAIGTTFGRWQLRRQWKAVLRGDSTPAAVVSERRAEAAEIAKHSQPRYGRVQ